MRKYINSIKNIIHETDFFLIFICICASVFGVLAVHSATYNKVAEGAAYSRDTRTMIMAVALGLFAAILISFIDSEFIVRLWPIVAIVCVALMFFVMKWGKAPPLRPDAKIWIMLSTSRQLYFQPSELVKIGFVITFAVHLEQIRDKMNKPLSLLLLAIHAAIPTGLVAVSGDFGSALIFIVIFASMLFIGGLSLKNIGLGVLAMLAASPLLWKFGLKSIQKDRIMALIYPEQYPVVIYQQEKGLIAIGSGHLFGQGYLQGDYTQASVVPASENDMIFSVIGEELGFIGCIAAIIIFTIIVLKIISIGRQCKDNTSALMCYGIASMIIGHVVINIGMCLMLLPVVGITLPFFSAGGSSNLCLYIGIGLILSIYRFNHSRNIVNYRLRRVSTPFSDE